MKTIGKCVLALAVTVAGLADQARAADFGGGAEHPSQYCYTMRRSPILDLASADQMQSEVRKRYDHALDVSEQNTTIASASPRFPWSTEAKVACGKAIGYFSGREVNEDMISKCDCYYGRMLRFVR